MGSRIFIHHDGALGDVLLSLPAMRLIRGDSNFIHLAANPDIAGLLLEAGFIKEASRVGSSIYLSLYSGVLDDNAMRFFSQFERALVFTARETSVIDINIRTVLPDTIVIQTIPDEKINTAEFRLRQLADKSKIVVPCNVLTYEYTSTYLKISPDRLEYTREFLLHSGYDSRRPIIAVHPGSGGAKKCWMRENYLELIEILMRKHAPYIIIFSGPAESDSCKAEINNFINGKKHIIHITGEELIMVASLLKLCNIYLGNDSGISHLASMLCRKVIVLFGPTDHLLWRPPFENVAIISSDYQCAPCDTKMLKDCMDTGCLSKIPVSRVYEEIVNLLGK